MESAPQNRYIALACDSVGASYLNPNTFGIKKGTNGGLPSGTKCGPRGSPTDDNDEDAGMDLRLSECTSRDIWPNVDHTRMRPNGARERAKTRRAEPPRDDDASTKPARSFGGRRGDQLLCLFVVWTD